MRKKDKDGWMDRETDRWREKVVKEENKRGKEGRREGSSDSEIFCLF